MTTTTRKHHGRLIDTEVRIDATPMRVWQAWADPQHIANWFVDRAEGVAAPGKVMTWFFDAFNMALPVPIVEAEPGRTFVTGGGEAPGPHGLRLSDGNHHHDAGGDVHHAAAELRLQPGCEVR